MLHPGVFQELNVKWGPFDMDLFAAHHNAQLSRFFSYRLDPLAEAVDALNQTWTAMHPYAFPQFILLGRVLQKIWREKIHQAVLIAPIWPNQHWFPLFLESVSDHPIILPNILDLMESPAGETHTLIEQGRLHLAAWRVSGQVSVREVFRGSSHSSSWRPGTEKSYTCALRQWCSWCDQRKISVFPNTVTPIIEFITQKFQEGKQYSTLNLIRSALSATIPPIEGQPVGQYPLVCRALQGSRPPMPKYTSTWDVHTVVQFGRRKWATIWH